MFKITDILSLGTVYSVTDPAGNVITSIQVVPHKEILEAALGEFNPELGNYTSYLERSVAVLSGTESVKFTDILWYSTEEEEVSLSEVIEYAVRHNYSKIILEHITPE